MTPVCYAIASSEVGGSQRSLTLLLQRLDRRAYPPFVLLGESGPLEDNLRELAVPYEISPRAFRTPGGVAHFVRVARRERARVLHLYATRALAAAGRALGLAVVERVNILRSREAGGLVAWRVADRMALRLADRIIVPSQVMAAQLLSRGVPASKIRLVPNAVTLPLPTADRLTTRQALGVERAFVVLCVGRLARLKGHDVLIDAMRLVGKSCPDTQLVLAGSGPKRAALERQATEAGVRVLFLGDRADISDLLAACDVYVQPSFSESFGNAVREAMLAGRPVVASAVGGLLEAVTHGVTGRLVPPGEACELASAIVALAHDPVERDALGARARDWMADTSSLDRMCRATEAVYQEALACR